MSLNNAFEITPEDLVVISYRFFETPLTENEAEDLFESLSSEDIYTCQKEALYSQDLNEQTDIVHYSLTQILIKNFPNRFVIRQLPSKEKIYTFLKEISNIKKDNPTVFIGDAFWQTLPLEIRNIFKSTQFDTSGIQDFDCFKNILYNHWLKN